MKLQNFNDLLGDPTEKTATRWKERIKIFSDKENQESEFQMEGQSNPILKIYQNF